MWQILLEVPRCSPLLDARAQRQAKDFSKSFLIYANHIRVLAEQNTSSRTGNGFFPLCLPSVRKEDEQ